MTVSSIYSSPAYASAAAQTSSVTGSAGMDSDFMLLLLAQLRNQNPLEPLQDKDMMAQLTQISSLSELQQINSSISAMANKSSLGEAAALIGKSVQYNLGQGVIQDGVVTGVSVDGGQIMLWLGDLKVPMSAVLSINAAEA